MPQVGAGTVNFSGRRTCSRPRGSVGRRGFTIKSLLDPDVRDATPATRPDPFAFNQVGNMPQAIVDPSELRRFAQMLKKFNNEMGERMSALANQLNDLTNSWRDQEQTKFRVEFEQHMKMIARFIEANNQHIPYLLRKAERIEEYMQQR
jgi:uncharacterized protein YukE